MKQAGCARWRCLKLGNSVPIKTGDVCSLLPDKCWFKIISMPDTMEENDKILKRKADENLNNEVDSKKACLLSKVEIVSPSETLKDMLNDKDASNEHQNSDINTKSEHNNDTAPVLQEIHSAGSSEGSSMAATCSKMSADSQNTIELCDKQQNDKKQEGKNISKSKATTNIAVGKKIKWDCNAPYSDRTEISASPTQNSRSSRQNQANVQNPVRPVRDKCVYGARCYRKNPNHKNNYSHPADSDYEVDDDREECPYGMKCYRKNSHHKSQFKHTSQPQSRRRRAATPMHTTTVDTAFETDCSSAEESVDESDYEPSVYTESSDDSDEIRSEQEDGTTG